MTELSWDQSIGLGVAGNFAGHLEQAGEASDFDDVVTLDARAPKGVFPFYVPGSGSHFLHRYPISDREIRLGSPDEKHQIEPEVALRCELRYENGDGPESGRRVVRVIPREAMAHNDCSIRREGAKKISEKKNWGRASKGTARGAIPIDRFEAGGNLDHFRLASYLIRDGETVPYGVDSALSSYSYMYGELLTWLVDTLNDQRDEGPLENISDWLALAGHPTEALISIGATRYTEFGETTFLEAGDESVVVVYDARQSDEAAIRQVVLSGEDVAAPLASILRQKVV